MREVPADESLVVVATGKYVGEGFDEPRLDTILLAMPISWKGTLSQYAGRLHRSVVWYGNIDYLSYSAKEASALRFESPDIAGELLELWQKGDDLDQLRIEPE